MLLLITYDVCTTDAAGRRRLARIAKECCNYGQRVQNSVFECVMDNAKYIEVRAKMLKIIDREKDSLRIYNLGNKYNNKIEQYGINPSFDQEGVLVL